MKSENSATSLLFNLVLVASLGLLIRYVSIYGLNGININNLHHSHSHFAFAAWVSQSLYFLLSKQLTKGFTTTNYWKVLYFLQNFTAFGMLVFFAYQGYALFSIIFSTFNLIINVVIVIHLFKAVSSKQLKNKSLLLSALFFNAFSAIGTSGLVYLMATGQQASSLYQASIYFYLHFQYNGWFILTILGLFANLPGIRSPQQTDKISFWIILSVFFSYALSLLPLYSHWSLYLIGSISGFVQLVGICSFIILLIQHNSEKIKSLSASMRWTLLTVSIGIFLKVCIQFLSVFPSLHELGFKNHPILIAYLHLVFLMITSLFILASFISSKSIKENRVFTVGMYSIIIAILLNEFVLLGQGTIGQSTRINFPFLQLITSVLLWTSALTLLLSQTKLFQVKN
jgi:hypothetical protein